MKFTQAQLDAHQRRNGFAPVPMAAPLVTEAEKATAARVEDKAERDVQARILAYLTQHREKGTVRGVIRRGDRPRPPVHRAAEHEVRIPRMPSVDEGGRILTL